MLGGFFRSVRACAYEFLNCYCRCFRSCVVLFALVWSWGGLWAILGRLGAVLERSCGDLMAVLGGLGAILGGLGAVLGRTFGPSDF